MNDNEKELVNIISDLLQMIDHGGPTQPSHKGSCGPWANCDCECVCAYYDYVLLDKAREIVKKQEKVS